MTSDDLKTACLRRLESERDMDVQIRRSKRDGAAEVSQLQQEIGDEAFVEWANSLGAYANVVKGWTAIARMDDGALDAMQSAGWLVLAERAHFENGSHDPAELLNYIHRRITGEILSAYENAKKAGALLVGLVAHIPGGSLRDWLVEHFDGTAEEAGVFLHAHSMTPAQFAIRMAAITTTSQE